MDKIYVDTNVYIDLFEGRKDRFRDLGEFALNVFRKIREGEYSLVISDWVIEEFKKYRSEEEINRLVSDLKKEQVITILRADGDEKQARELSNNNFPDALHVVLAKKGNAICIVTRNIQDFAEFRNLIEIRMPEEL
ncbi:PIN domain-containing protein [Candidatus Woesearchaeota archaeon]|nr:MAG: PIN domain-containing protein [Candidatus Woesearchaeota archaeon]